MRGRPYFVISRRLATADGEFADADWQATGTVQEKTFTDDQVPTGYAFATYRVVARRGTEEAADPAFAEVPFGSTTNVKLAGRIGTPGSDETREAA